MMVAARLMALVFLLGAVAPAADAARGKKIDLAVKDADIRDVLTFLARQARTNLVMTEKVSGRVTVYLNQVRVADAIRAVAAVRGLDVSTLRGVVLVSTREEARKRLEHSRELRRLRRPPPE